MKLTDELLGNNVVETDHGGVTLGDIIVLLLDLVLLIYTGWRSYDFLSSTVPNDLQVMALVGLWGLDIGAVSWSLVWIFGSSTKYQDWTSMGFFLLDLVGVVLTSITDALMYGSKDATMTKLLTGIAVVIIPLVVVANVIAGFIYHMTSPQTKAARARRRAEADYQRKLFELEQMEAELSYAAQYLQRRQETLEKSAILAELRMEQDAIEAATRKVLKGTAPVDNLQALREKIKGLKAKIGKTNEPEPETAVPAVPDTPAVLLSGNGHKGANDPFFAE